MRITVASKFFPIFVKAAGKAWGVGLLVYALGSPLAAGAERVANTKHNLSATGPGNIKTSGTSAVCVFCHTPHNANPSQSLWNQALPGASYVLYSSSTLAASPDQPTGSSRLCLSCHDGTLALGSLRVPASGGPTTFGPLTGQASLGTDLSNDHPISFVYDAALATTRGELVDPASLPADVHLDGARRLQCTACHDPHDATYRKFLRRDDRFGALCTACHRPKNWTGSAHAMSSATWSGTGTNPWPTGPFTTVAEGGCESCHRPHAASQPVRLLSSAQERGVCLVCHNGAVASKNLESEFLKSSVHPVASTDGIHQPLENPSTMARHVSCADCHNPHQVAGTSANLPLVPGRLRGVRGVDLGGSAVSEARYEYEVCLKCHGIRDQATPGVVRQDDTRNVRVEINPGNASYHSVAAAGKHLTIQGLQPGYTASSLIGCSDCHNNDDWTSAGVRPKGPHGSRFAPILDREYQQGDPVTASLQAYALCYKCHNSTTLLTSGRFPHKDHVQEKQTSCAVCHDAHGSRQNIRLINFMLRDKTGKVVVSPNRNGLIQFTPTEPGRGECSLTCHGEEHDRKGY